MMKINSHPKALKAVHVITVTETLSVCQTQDWDADSQYKNVDVRTVICLGLFLSIFCGCSVQLSQDWYISMELKINQL